ncbi:MAG: DEAD/DEAH box helicase [Candidatus Tectomicrobia bacterium]|nr:DEAD/DEAH box helicase [Candidatus Tectomicrobia bacterium]
MLVEAITGLSRGEVLRGQLVHHEILPACTPLYGAPAAPLSPLLATTLRGAGIEQLYVHQAAALDAARAGRNVLLTTPTGSGKTLAFNLPIIEALLRAGAPAAAGAAPAHALYLFPLKALEQDQLQGLRGLLALLPPGARPLRADIYDGDTPPARRRKLRDSPPDILISNPDMLHRSLLAYHAQWAEFFRRLRFVVLDELHTYKGIFGSHVAQVLRRLRRLCAFYGARPQFIACSATIANAREFALRLSGLEFDVVARNGAPQTARHLLFVNPAGSPYTLAANLFKACLRAGLKTIAFTKARKITELLHAWCVQGDPELAQTISSYRAGFLPEERRQIEAKLFSGELHGVISTSALEMGVDIGGLDACLLVGYPGTITTTWQRAGRVGRADRPAVIFLIAQADALDQYFMRHPRNFFERGYESATLDPDNPEVLAPHLLCAAAELPLRADDAVFALPRHAPLLAELERSHQLVRSAAGDEWYAATRQPHRQTDIRAIGESFTIFGPGAREVVGTISGGRVLSECHEGAIYLHRARQHLITDLDLERRNVRGKPVEVNYYTRAQGEKSTSILSRDDSKPVANFLVRRGRLRVTSQILSFEKRRVFGGDLLSTHPLNLPPESFETVGLWIEIENVIKHAVQARQLHFMGAIHAVEHAAIALLPLFVLCERDDMGGISYAEHPEVGKAAIFLYDGYPGGVGLAAHAYTLIEELLRATLELLRDCPCEEGCPSCVHSPKCGSGNKPLDKPGAIFVLRALLGDLSLAELAQVQAERGQVGMGARYALSSGQAAADHQPAAVTASRRQEEPRIVTFDLETQRSAEEVGGWQNKHLMRVSLAVAYDSSTGLYTTYREEELDKLVALLAEADLVLGFNIAQFDFVVLGAYTPFDLRSLPVLDLLQEVQERLGFRLSLNHLAEKTLGDAKTAEGLQAITWFRDGAWEELEAYCRHDVELTHRLFRFGLEQGYLLYETKAGHLVRLPLDWDLRARCRQQAKG